MKQEQRFSVPAVGAGALLVVFAVLCLTVFSLLSLSTAQAEKRMADAAVESVQDYYAADLQAERIFARLRAGEQVSEVQHDGNIFRYRCPVSENQILEAEVKQKSDGWQVCRWQVVSSSRPISETLPVWNGQKS